MSLFIDAITEPIVAAVDDNCESNEEKIAAYERVITHLQYQIKDLQFTSNDETTED